MDLEEVAGELYALPPGDFVAARTEAARRARAAGDRALAREIGALGKPSTAAWGCNALVQEAPDEIAGLVELGDLLREAQKTLAGDELRRLGTQRSRLLAALTRQARAVAARRGHPLSDAVADQVEETLRAALADPDAGEALLAGRLTAPLSTRSLGFGGRPDLRVVPPPPRRTPSRPGRTAAAPAPRSRGSGREDAARRAAEERRRAARERRERELAAAREEADEARQAAAEAEETARAAAERAERAARRQEELAAHAEELAAELERVRGQVATAEAEAARASRRSAAADRAAERAADDRDRAAARVTELEQAPLEA